ncbi:MAG: drug/metabolite transporter (DMT)-like permease [Gammaproteobacteria bacterium]|jgi:drug/metabolite transporter (DMT)-like permease
MAFLAMGDAAIKVLSGSLSQSVILIVIGIGLFSVFFTISFWTKDQIFDRRALYGFALLRSVAEVSAAFFMVLALSTVPFTILTLIMQSMPLIVTLGAVLFFGEQVGWRRWIAIGIGFIGVIVILRPGTESFSAEWLFAVIAAIALSFRDLASRAVPKSVSTLQISCWGGGAVFLAGLCLQVYSDESIPTFDLTEAWLLFFVTLCWASGVFAVSLAMRIGELSLVAPFRYTRIPFGLLIGVLFFAESVDMTMLTGAAIIVLSGLYVFSREQKGKH